MYHRDDSPLAHIKGDIDSLPYKSKYSLCPYFEQVARAMLGRQVIMNFSSFLYQTFLTERFHKRHLMVIDECHNTEAQLLNFVSFTLTDGMLKEFGIFIPKLSHPVDYLEWMEEAKVMDTLRSAMIHAERESDVDKVEDLRQMLTKQPVFVHHFSHRFLFNYADHVLMMSATVLDVDVLCRSLGVKREEVAALRMRSRFPVENRPIIIKSVAKMTGGKKQMPQWAPKLAKGVNHIVKMHAGERGIIHTHNFAIMEYLLNNCKQVVRDRFLNQRDFRDKMQMLEEHAGSDDTVIVAPAMHEGLDLAGDLSRFQIICKVPYANFFDDAQLSRRVELDRRYYTWMTALKLVQSYGRSIRSEDDHAVTYIMDSAIHFFLKQARSMMPQWFTEAIQDD
jgi:Rad3-related DNA helicase